MSPRRSSRARRRTRSRRARSDEGRHGFFWRWRRVFFAIGLVLVAAVAGVAYVFSQVPLPSKDPPLPQTSFICAADVSSGCNADNAMAQLRGGQDRIDVAYDQIPKVLVDAVVAAEDKNFFKHNGVDPTGIARALWEDLTGSQSEQGGSTITQQYVKTVYLTNERSVARKIKEAVLAVKLERQLPKTEILNRYLNAIYFGRGAYGVEAASKAYFGKDVGALTLPEAAYLAGLIRSPGTADAALPRTDPDAKSGRETAIFRRTSVLENMRKAHDITEAQYEQAVNAPWTDVVPLTSVDRTSTVSHTELGTQYIVDYVRKTLVASGRFTDAELYGGGLRIYTTIDYGLQQDAIDAERATLPYTSEPSAGLVAIDPSGRVKAMLGGLDYSKSQVNLATGTLGGGSGRNAGSTFKAFAIAEALQQGMSLNQYYDTPSKLTVPASTGCAAWPVGNDDDHGHGYINMATATADSVNTYFAQLVRQIGAQNLATMARQMGVITPLSQPICNSLVLGGHNPGFSPLDMASGYSTLMDGGVHVAPYVVSRVTDASGQVLYQAPSTGHRVLSQDTVAKESWLLSQVIQRGTGTSAQFGESAAGKTGTTDNFTDAWFTGYTCKLTASVWVGYPKGEISMQAYGDQAFGKGFPATIWREFMKKATEGLQSCEYPRPNDAGSYVAGPAVSDQGTSSDTVSTSSSTSSTTSTTRPTGTTTTTVPASSTTTSSTTPPSSTTTTTATATKPP
jgi:penicillin-binding protein 1A